MSVDERTESEAILPAAPWSEEQEHVLAERKQQQGSLPLVRRRLEMVGCTAPHVLLSD